MYVPNPAEDEERNALLTALAAHGVTGLTDFGHFVNNTTYFAPSTFDVRAAWPGSVLALIAALEGGYWAGAWAFGLTAWAFLSSELTTSSRPHRLLPRLLRLLLGIILTAPLSGLALFWPNPIAYLLAFIPWGLLLLDHYSHRPWRAATDCALGTGLLVLLITVPPYWLSPEGSIAGISAISGFGITWLTRRRS